MKTVLVTRPQEQAEEFAKKLEKAGFKVYIEPMLEYRSLKIDLSDIENYKYLVFTSSQAIKCFCDICPKRDFLVFTVGDRTSEIAKESGFKKIYSAGGNAKTLVKLIVDNKENILINSLLHIRGEDVFYDIYKELIKNGISYDKKVIYKAEYKNNFSKKIIEVLSEKKIDIISLFSVRTAKNFIKLLYFNKLDKYTKYIELACLSESIAIEAKKISWKNILIADQPNSISFLKKIKN